MKKIYLALALLFLMTGCGETKETTKAILNNNPEIIKEQTVNTFIMNNVSLCYKDGVSTLIVTVTNTSSEAIDVNQFDIVLKTENGSIITTLNGSVGDSMEGKSSLTITVTSDVDLSDAYSLEYQMS